MSWEGIAKCVIIYEIRHKHKKQSTCSTLRRVGSSKSWSLNVHLSMIPIFHNTIVNRLDKKFILNSKCYLSVPAISVCNHGNLLVWAPVPKKENEWKGETFKHIKKSINIHSPIISILLCVTRRDWANILKMQWYTISNLF